MPTPTNVKAPVHFVRTCITSALNSLTHGDDAEALTRLNAAIHEADIAIARIDDAFNPASLVLKVARSGADSSQLAIFRGETQGAIGGVRATLAALNNIPAIIEAQTD